MSAETPPFARTVCACQECVALCKKQPGPLAVGDFERIAERLGEDVARAKLWQSPGAIVGTFGEDGVLLHRVPSITPRADASGRCVFLGADDRCEIHDVAPFGCAFFDVHMGAREADRRSGWYLRRNFHNREYLALRSTLAASPAVLKTQP